MRFDQEGGFSGTSGARLRSAQIQNYGDLFSFSDECTQLALTVSALLPELKIKRQLVVGLFFARCLSHYQAGISLAQGGMVIESLSLSRGLFETVFVMLAIAEDAVEPGELARHDAASRVKHANALLNSKDYPNVKPFVEQLGDFVHQYAGSTTIDMREFARRGNALAAYDGLYRHLSHHASHPSLSAVVDYLIRGEEGRLQAQFRPLLDKTPAAVLSACAGILLACFAIDKVGVKTIDTNTTVNLAWARFEALYEYHNPWS